MTFRYLPSASVLRALAAAVLIRRQLGGIAFNRLIQRLFCEMRALFQGFSVINQGYPIPHGLRTNITTLNRLSYRELLIIDMVLSTWTLWVSIFPFESIPHSLGGVRWRSGQKSLGTLITLESPQQGPVIAATGPYLEGQGT